MTDSTYRKYFITTFKSYIEKFAKETLSEREKFTYKVFSDFFGEENTDIQLFTETFLQEPLIETPKVVQRIPGIARKTWFYLEDKDTTVSDLYEDIDENSDSYSSNAEVGDVENMKSFLRDYMDKKDEDDTLRIMLESLDEKKFYDILMFILHYVINYDIQDFLKSNHSMICIHFPKEIIENEKGMTHTLYDVYLKVILLENGCINTNRACMLKRTSFTLNELVHGYVHSHVNCSSSHHMLRYNEGNTFSSICTGSGPINNILVNLVNAGEYLKKSEDDKRIILTDFCYNLKKLVNVESLSGGPYIKMEYLDDTFNKVSPDDDVIPIEISTMGSVTKGFFKWFIKNTKLRFVYNNFSWHYADSLLDFYFLISNKYIEFMDTLIRNNPTDEEELTNIKEASLYDYIYKDGFLYSRISESGVEFERGVKEDVIAQLKEHPFAFLFKGKFVPYKLIKEENNDNSNNYVRIFSREVSLSLLNSIIEFLNVNGDKYDENRKDTPIPTANITRTF